VRIAQPKSEGPIVPEVGALRQWRLELEAGSRTIYDTDAIWHAACLEARARDALREGLVAAVNDDRRRAAEIIIAAATSEVA
jgi:hypothetical protein